MKTIKPYILIILFYAISLNAFTQTLEIPQITNVSVDIATQQALINWSMNNPAQVDGYIIKRQIFGQPGVVEGSYNTVETIYDANQFSYLDVSTSYGPSLPGSGVETYRVASFKDNGGGNLVFSNMSEPVSTIYLSPVEFDLCKETNSLVWTSYNGYGDNLTGYNVYYTNTLGGVLTLIEPVAANDTNYVHEQVEANVQYYYYVEALSNQAGLTSYSNMQSIFTNMPALPEVMNADYATVELNDQVDLSFTLDEDAEINAYLLLKSNSIDGTYDTIARYPAGTASIYYSDFISTDKEIGYYKILAINTCGLPSRESNVANNIVLETRPVENTSFQNQLNWNAYEDWLGGVADYVVYRSIDGGAYTEVANVPSNTLSYTDDVSQFVQPEINGQASKGQFCYYIEATEAPGNPYGIIGVSKSNVSCVQQEAVVYLPNAFNPQSSTIENRTFKPVATFVNGYQLIIYSRWGDIVFQSSDPLQGWDGRNKGKLLKKGTYVFYLKYKDRNNKLVEKSGQINLVY